uniref:Uncharacterized protein n=1 Tax=Panagrolaimus sp. PS1159 TaxID=55785 RepID=A0AC35GHG7_9BILA
MGCYGFGLILVILERFVFKRGIKTTAIRKPSKDIDDDEESNKPFIPSKPDNIEKPRPRPPKPIQPDIHHSPSIPDPDEIVIGGENDDNGDDVDIDI